jgi:RNA polymerase sigma-70 factor (ECF subfamily)
VRLLGNVAEAEDVCQETFTRLWQSAAAFVPRAKPSTWLYRIAHNLAIDRLRRRRSTDADAVDALPGSGRPSALLVHKQVAERVRAALDQLPERQRAAITLSYYQGMSQAEIAEVLDVSVRAVESLLSRARRELRESLASLREEHGADSEGGLQ